MKYLFVNSGVIKSKLRSAKAVGHEDKTRCVHDSVFGVIGLGLFSRSSSRRVETRVSVRSNP